MEDIKDTCISKKVRLEFQGWSLDVSEATGEVESWKLRVNGSWEQKTSPLEQMKARQESLLKKSAFTNIFVLFLFFPSGV